MNSRTIDRLRRYRLNQGPALRGIFETQYHESACMMHVYNQDANNVLDQEQVGTLTVQRDTDLNWTVLDLCIKRIRIMLRLINQGYATDSDLASDLMAFLVIINQHIGARYSTSNLPPWATRLKQEIIEKLEQHFQELEMLYGELKTLVEELKMGLENLQVKVGRLDMRFGTLETQVGGLQMLIGGLETRLGNLDMRFGTLETRFGTLETKVGGLHTQIGGLETRFGTLETQVGELRMQVGGLQTRLGKLELRFREQKTQIEKITTDVGGMRSEMRFIAAFFALCWILYAWMV